MLYAKGQRLNKLERDDVLRSIVECGNCSSHLPHGTSMMGGSSKFLTPTPLKYIRDNLLLWEIWEAKRPENIQAKTYSLRGAICTLERIVLYQNKNLDKKTKL